MTIQTSKIWCLQHRSLPRKNIKKTTDWEWCWLVDELGWELKDLTIYDVDSLITTACRLKIYTDELQNSYIELQDIIRSLIKRCENSTSLRKHKEAKARDRKCIRSEEEKKKQMIYDDTLSCIRLMMIEKDAGESWREKETVLTMIRPGSALTGGISLGAFYDPYEIFESIRRGKELEVLKRAYHQSQEDTVAATEVKLFVQRMKVQRKDALERLETIIKAEDGNSGIECLREVEKHLKYINIQFGRINGCWSEVISAIRLKSLKTKELFHSSDGWTRTVQNEWEFVEELFLRYYIEIRKDVIDLFRFLRESKTDDPAQRRQDLFLAIGKEISGTYLSPDSGESADQHKTTDVKGKAQLFPGEEISGTYFPPDSGKSSYQRKDTDIKGKAKLYPGEEISEKSKCTIL
ncbi:uncharacterized protein LOC123531839 isoform X3 [Mercenaria mercenaria]|uniref:uncharacterized protein LOC123531839 isoform X3 n=1 Tax=Mercenaria mercenaria TaxID=6596 RepID=UPI00234EB5A1|nr:uncharacterized protein LOC123531839 isoform X3 [Mercenaria mercenaria]